MKYKELIITKHAQERMINRGIWAKEIWATWRNPDRSRYAATKSAWIYKRHLNGKNIEVVAKKNEAGEWLILSAWSKPSGFLQPGQPRPSLLRRLFIHLFQSK